MPIAKGRPAEGYPWPWSVYRWLPGEIASVAKIADLSQFARDVAGFLVALAAVDPTGGPGPGAHNFYRGGSLTVYDAETRQAVVDLGDRIDGAAALRVWDAALAATWAGPAVWFHGDIATGNLLVRDGRLSAVIDFGTSGVGDPACDLAITWTLFSGGSREVYRAAYPADRGMWARARAWTLWKALIVAAGLAKTRNPEGDRALEIAREVIADHERVG
jgi:aminoglycoside phosphotransferase (APT) family kinase protein